MGVGLGGGGGVVRCCGVGGGGRGYLKYRLFLPVFGTPGQYLR